MSRTIISILLIFLFMLSQYGRQLAYLQCKIENFSVKTNTATCDCEKDSDNDLSKSGTKLPVQKIHIHISLDEYYELNENNYAAFSEIKSIQFPKQAVYFLSSFNGNIFHPPQFS